MNRTGCKIRNTNSAASPHSYSSAFHPLHTVQIISFAIDLQFRKILYQGKVILFVVELTGKLGSASLGFAEYHSLTF